MNSQARGSEPLLLWLELWLLFCSGQCEPCTGNITLPCLIFQLSPFIDISSVELVRAIDQKLWEVICLNCTHCWRALRGSAVHKKYNFSWSYYWIIYPYEFYCLDNTFNSKSIELGEVHCYARDFKTWNCSYILFIIDHVYFQLSLIVGGCSFCYFFFFVVVDGTLQSYFELELELFISFPVTKR